MKYFNFLIAAILIATQAQAGVISNFVGREMPQRVDVSATAASTTIGSVTFTDAGDLVTFNKHGLAAGEAVQFGTITSTTGISINTTYYVINPTTNTFQLASTPGGSALPLTTNGTGVLSTSYYAVVHAQVRNGGTFSVDGTVFLTSNTWNAITSNSSPSTITLTGTASGASGAKFLNAPYTYTSTFQVPTTNISGSSVNSGLTTSGTLSSGHTTADAFSNATAMTSITNDFRVPVGTVIVGSGNASYVIEIIKI